VKLMQKFQRAAGGAPASTGTSQTATPSGNPAQDDWRQLELPAALTHHFCYPRAVVAS
jgi:hypothetical protein